MTKLTAFLSTLFFVLLSATAGAQGAELGCIHPDFIALETFYYAANGEDWTNADGWMDNCEPCSWYGVRCNGEDRVTAIVLSNNNLIGNLSTAVADLPYLEYLSMKDNALTGQLPAGLMDLDLNGIYLSNNQMSGPIPAGIDNLENLRHLHLSNNNFSGPIPAGLSNLTNLRRVHLDGNNFSGNFPADVSAIASLEILDVRDNALSGCLPEDLRDRCGNAGFRFGGNSGLPWMGDLSEFCLDGLTTEQIGAPCDDGDPTTDGDVIIDNCSCGQPQPDGITTGETGLGAEGESNGGAPGNDSVGGDGEVADAQGVTAPFNRAITLFSRELNVYPNPVSGQQLNISLPGATGAGAVRLLSITGSVVANQTFDGEAAQLNMPALEPGMYLVEAVSGGVRTVRRVMVE